MLAQRTGAPIIGAVATASSAWRLKSWDSIRHSQAVRSRERHLHGGDADRSTASLREATQQSDAMCVAMASAEKRIAEQGARRIGEPESD